MKLEHIEQVVEIVKCRSISKAAEKLFVSQSSLSLSIKNLENEIGCALFHRTNKGVEITAFGREYALFAETILLQLRQLKKMEDSRTHCDEQIFSIFNEGYRYVNHAVASIYKKHAQERIRIEIHEGAWGDAASKIEDGTSMIGMVAMFSHYKKTVLRQYEARGLQYFRFCRNPVTIVLGPMNPLFERKEKTLSSEALKPYPLIIYSNFDIGPYSNVPDILGFGHSQNKIVVNSRAAMYDMLEKTNGFTITTTNQIAYKNTDYYPKVHSFVLGNSKISAEIGWIKKKNYNPPSLVLEYLQILSEYYTEHEV